MDWRNVELSGASSLSRLSSEYEVIAPKVPQGGRFKIKVLERQDGTFIAMPNVCLRDPDGSPDWLAGKGDTDAEALENALRWFMAELAKRDQCQPEDFEWSDPVDF